MHSDVVLSAPVIFRGVRQYLPISSQCADKQLTAIVVNYAPGGKSGCIALPEVFSLTCSGCDPLGELRNRARCLFESETIRWLAARCKLQDSIFCETSSASEVIIYETENR
jgi:hypothetical protein